MFGRIWAITPYKDGVVYRGDFQERVEYPLKYCDIKSGEKEHWIWLTIGFGL